MFGYVDSWTLDFLGYSTLCIFMLFLALLHLKTNRWTALPGTTWLMSRAWCRGIRSCYWPRSSYHMISRYIQYILDIKILVCSIHGFQVGFRFHDMGVWREGTGRGHSGLWICFVYPSLAWLASWSTNQINYVALFYVLFLTLKPEAKWNQDVRTSRLVNSDDASRILTGTECDLAQTYGFAGTAAVGRVEALRIALEQAIREIDANVP